MLMKTIALNDHRLACMVVVSTLQRQVFLAMPRSSRLCHTSAQSGTFFLTAATPPVQATAASSPNAKTCSLWPTREMLRGEMHVHAARTYIVSTGGVETIPRACVQLRIVPFVLHSHIAWDRGVTGANATQHAAAASSSEMSRRTVCSETASSLARSANVAYPCASMRSTRRCWRFCFFGISITLPPLRPSVANGPPPVLSAAPAAKPQSMTGYR